MADIKARLQEAAKTISKKRLEGLKMLALVETELEHEESIEPQHLIFLMMVREGVLYSRFGRSPYKNSLRSMQWKQTRDRILKRDSHKCQDCGAKEHLNVHHMGGYLNGHKPWEYPDEKLLTLCQSCHALRPR